MACILKAPSSASCGVIVFTTHERDQQIKLDSELQKAIGQLKKRWLIGLHHNWHDWNFKHDPLFDFSMAGDGDLREVHKKDFPRISMDACNFVPNSFRSGSGEKFWDILYVARAVNFKRIPEFFSTIRQLYDSGYKYRVLFICPVPPYSPSEEKTVFYKIRETYDKMFSEDEKNLFNLLTIEYRYPFPFDLETLAHFYRSCKVFVHTADDERRCRVASYAWASGLPVVGMDCVGGLLPEEARNPPYFFETKRYSDFPKLITKAIDSFPMQNWDCSLMQLTFSESHTPNILDQCLSQIAQDSGHPFRVGDLSRKNLSIRLGRHHNNTSGPNSIDSSLPSLVQWLERGEVDLQAMLDSNDPEKTIQASMKGTHLGRKLLERFFPRVHPEEKS